MNETVDANTIEYLINRALKKESYIEVISLVHNVIELYLRFHIERHISKLDNKEIYNNKLKLDILHNKSKTNFLKYLIDYLEICFLFNIIDEDLYKDILKFNSNRNKVIHNLIKSKPKKGVKYQDIIEIARLGRIIQLRLSPLNHTSEDITRILYYFDNPDKIEEIDTSARFENY